MERTKRGPFCATDVDFSPIFSNVIFQYQGIEDGTEPPIKYLPRISQCLCYIILLLFSVDRASDDMRLRFGQWHLHDRKCYNA